MTAYIWWLPAILAFALALGVPALRRTYINGFRCATRHPILWKLPAGLAFVYGIFDLMGSMLLHWRLGNDWYVELDWQPLDQTEWIGMAEASLLPAAEQLAALFNGLVSTFPISAIAALLFLLNYRGLAGETRRALRRRLGWRGWFVLLGLFLCALAALLKPASILALPELSLRLPWTTLLPALTLMNALAFIFEYLLGTMLQLYLLLTAYAWIRGLQFDREKLLPFAVRRMGFVFKWSFVVITVTLILVHLPLLAEAALTGQITWLTGSVVRPLLVIAMLIFGSVQIRLALHNDSLREAISANLSFLRSHGWAYTAFLLIGLGLLLTLQTLALMGRESIGHPLAGQAAFAFAQTFVGAASGYLLASWVCLYKGWETGAKEFAY